MRNGTETILLVEDEEALRDVLRMVLKHLGYRVLEAGSGPEAIAVWQQHRQDIKLLLTDLMMPGGLTGSELAEQLRREAPKLKVILASGYSAEMAGKNLLLEKGVKFISKPFEPMKIAGLIRDVLDCKD